MSDLIDRRDAIDALMSILDMDNHAEFLYTDEICRALGQLPSAQAEIIQCKDCKFYDGRPCGIVDWYNTADDFCSRAERRTDETN